MSKSKEPAVTKYIENQEQHHKEVTFEEEFLGLLEKHGIEYDRRFVFD